MFDCALTFFLVQAVCLTPTHELARNAYNVVKLMGQFWLNRDDGVLLAIPEEPKLFGERVECNCSRCERG